MAIDRRRTDELLHGIEELFDKLPDLGSPFVKDEVKRLVLGPALEEIKKLISGSRPPCLYLVGRSGDGKSSLLNALVGREVAEVSHVRRCQTESERYYIDFPEVYASWDVYDSRGIFDPDLTDEQTEQDALAFLEEDLIAKQPDVILHVVSAQSVRNLQQDLLAFSRLSQNLKRRTGFSPKTLLVLTKVDLLGDREVWPPDATKAGLILDLIDYLQSALRIEQTELLDVNNRLRGVRMLDSEYLAIIPVCCYMSPLRDDRWNIDWLQEYIGAVLPEAAQLDYVQSQKRKDLLLKLSSSIIKRFAAIAGGIGAIPIPVPDITLLTPLQLLMISIIGGLSCRPLSLESAKAYLLPAGGNMALAVGLRNLSRQLIKLIPIGGSAISGTLAASSTWGIGKAAEAYFFFGKKLKAEDLAAEYKNEA
ncbi:MAG: hypothetical protein GX060_00970 [Firmicutes bacterium]|nr:hypothetical protein [Bacillota bacterium]